MGKINYINNLIMARASDVSVQVKKSWRGAEYRHLRKVRRRRDRKMIPAYPFCKNCGEPLQGIYCHRCGQYALDINQPFGRYIIEYFSNAYQYDGRLPATFRLLFFKPGRLTSEFEAGRINSYVHPLKLYMFISIVFFGVILAFVPALQQEDYLLKKTNEWKDTTAVMQQNVDLEIDKAIMEVKNSMAVNDPVLQEQITRNIKDVAAKAKAAEKEKILQKETGSKKKEDGEAEDSRKLSEIWKLISAETQQTVPLVMMCLLPLYALILRFFYRKRKKKYLLCFVYSIHIQSLMLLLIAVLVIALVFCPVMWINSALLWTFSIYFLLYLMISSHNFFREKWWKSVIKGPVVFGTYFFICFISIFVVLIIKMVDKFS